MQLDEARSLAVAVGTGYGIGWHCVGVKRGEIDPREIFASLPRFLVAACTEDAHVVVLLGRLFSVLLHHQFLGLWLGWCDCFLPSSTSRLEQKKKDLNK